MPETFGKSIFMRLSKRCLWSCLWNESPLPQIWFSSSSIWECCNNVERNIPVVSFRLESKVIELVVDWLRSGTTHPEWNGWLRACGGLKWDCHLTSLSLFLCVEIQRKILESNVQPAAAPSRGKTLPTPVQSPPYPFYTTRKWNYWRPFKIAKNGTHLAVSDASMKTLDLRLSHSMLGGLHICLQLYSLL